MSSSGTPLGPTVPTGSPSRTAAPRRTPNDPRCTSVTEYPSAVWIVTILPPPGTLPANETVPEAGAPTGAPAGAPMSIPRCWPAAYGWAGSKENPISTGPATGQVQPMAEAGTIRAAAAAARSRRIWTETSVVKYANAMTVAGPGCSCQIRLQGCSVEAVAGHSGEPRDDVGRLTARHARLQQLRNRRLRCALVRPGQRRVRPEHERDLALHCTVEPPSQVGHRAADNFLEPLGQLPAHRRRPIRNRARENTERCPQALRRLECHHGPGPPGQLLA